MSSKTICFTGTRWLWIGCFFFVFLLPNTVSGQGGPSPQRALKLMDTDGDGKISSSEWIRPPQAFRRIDSNQDGFLTSEELSVFMGGPARATSPGRPAPAAATSTGPAYQIIDTHVHFGAGANQRNFSAGASEALVKMPTRNIATAIVIPTPQVGYDANSTRYDYNDLRNVARDSRFKIGGGSGLFGEWLHTKTAITKTQQDEFHSLALRMVEDGIVAFGEIGLNHFAVPGQGNRYGGIAIDHPLLKVLGDVAAETDTPIDIHFDVVPSSRPIPRPLAGAGNPDYLDSNLRQFENFLSENRGAKIVWAHAGFEPSPFRTAELNASLLRRHSNLYMSIRLMRGAPNPSAAMAASGNLKSDWRQLFIEYSDRFVLGSESMYGSSQSGIFDKEFELFQQMLKQLPSDIARKIASENARRIYPLDRQN